MLRMLRAPFLLLLIPAIAVASYAETILVPYTAFPNPEEALKVMNVLDHCTFKHTLKEKRFNSTSKVFNYLLDRMPLTTAMMRELGLANYTVSTRPDGVMMCDDHEGVVGTLEPVYTTPEKRIIYGDGSFDAPVIGKMRGESVVVLDYVEEEPGVICNTVTVYVRVHSFLAPLMKLASPVVRGMVTRKSATLLNASMTLSERLWKEPGTVLDEIDECEDITPADKEGLRKTFVADTAMKR
ncbi:MAG TPA: hypothetical protein VM223_24525 [Planctomycetota bacterium]|nr:hypothetical protein [Planctomycetota bacterium]